MPRPSPSPKMPERASLSSEEDAGRDLRALRRRYLGALLVIALLAGLWWWRHPSRHDANEALQQRVHQGETMGTTYRIALIFEPGDIPPEDAWQRIIDDTLNEANRALSRFDAQGDVGRFNAHRDTSPLPVSPLTLAVVQRAQEISALTDGAFDITVAPLVGLFGFHDKTAPQSLPSDAELAAVREKVGWQKLAVDPAAGTLAKAHPELEIDLSAIAKGKGVDMLAEALNAAGAQNYMVEIGGEIRVRGHNRQRGPWRIGIEKPTEGTREVARIVSLQDMALATSGDYRSFYTLGEQRLSHTIDPRTGRPIENALASVTVLAPDCMSADALATAFTVMGMKRALDLAQREGIAAFLIARQGKNGFIDSATPRFQQWSQTGVSR